MEVIAAAFAAVVGFVDQRTDKVDAQPTDRSLASGHVEIRRIDAEWIERSSVVDKIDLDPTASELKCDRDIARSRMVSVTVHHDIGEELFEYDQEPGPLIAR
jgi:hypothetical protein